MTNIKFMYNGIKIDNKLIKGHYDFALYGDEFINDNIKAKFVVDDSVCDWNLRQLLKQYFDVKNDSDIMTDYFENDAVYFTENDKNINEVKEAFKKQEFKNIEKYLKYITKKSQTSQYYKDLYKNEFERVDNQIKKLKAA